MQPETWNPPMQTGRPGGQEWPGEVDGARKLVRLHPDEADQHPSAGAAHHADDPVRAHPPVRLVIRVDTNFYIRTKNLACLGILREAVQASQRVGRDGRAQPLDRVAVGVVVRRFDDDEVKQRGIGAVARPRHDREGPCVSRPKVAHPGQALALF